MNILILEEMEKQLLEIIGILTLDEPTEQIVLAKRRLAGMIQGIRIIVDAQRAMTLKEMEEMQFNRAQAVTKEFHKHLEHDATWGQ